MFDVIEVDFTVYVVRGRCKHKVQSLSMMLGCLESEGPSLSSSLLPCLLNLLEMYVTVARSLSQSATPGPVTKRQTSRKIGTFSSPWRSYCILFTSTLISSSGRDLIPTIVSHPHGQ